ncbi:hypothetical protein EV361DRAFT_874259, partial [Lentinula raphanica]
VMDFSGAQILAHSQEYANLMMSLTPGVDKLAKEAYNAQHTHYMQAASSSQVGCQVHFFRSAKRLKQNGNLIPKDLQGQFDEILYTMTSSSSSFTLENFNKAVETLQELFPQIHGWLEWWLRPRIASMIFPVYQTLDPETAQKVPHTSNPIEGSHSNLHSAMGSGHDAIPGIHKLFKYAKHRQDIYNAVIVTLESY